MSEKWPITEEGSLIIRQDSPVNFKELHKSLYTWAQENKYFFNEKGFVEKVKSHGKEFTIGWEFERKVNDFIKFNIEIEIWAHSMNPIEKDPSLLKGWIEIVVDSEMEMDWQNHWETNPIFKFLRKMYIYYLKKQYFLNYAGKCWEDTYGLHALIKSKLNQFSLF